MDLWAKKPISELADHTKLPGPQLNRVLGPIDLILLGIGAVIGAGLFSITGIAAAENAGPGITLAFMIAAVGCAFCGLCYSELTSMIPISGSAYTFTYAAMGEFIAWLIGWTLILEYAIGAAAVSISWSAYVVSLLQDLNLYLPREWVSPPWQTVLSPDGSLSYGWFNFPAFLIVAAISVLLMIGIKESSFVNNLMVTIKLCVVLIFIGVGSFYILPENYHPFIPPNEGEYGHFGWSGMLRAAGVLFFAYVGFDMVSTAAQEAKNPQKTIPIGILGSLFICTLLYILFSFVLTGIVNYKDLNVAAPVAVAVSKLPFPWLSGLIKLAVLTGLTSVILVMLLGQSRIFYAMSRDGLLPAWFAQIHPKFQTPWHSHLILLLFVGLFGALAPISFVGHLTSIGTLLAFVMVCGCVLILRYTQPDVERPFKVPFSPLFPLLGIAICLVMMFSLGTENWLRLMIWLAIGLVIYFVRRR